MAYNGWRNRPTWAINVWLTGDPWLYSEIEDIFIDAARSGKSIDEAREEAVDYLRSFIQERYEESLDKVDSIIGDAFLVSPENADVDYDRIVELFMNESDYQSLISASVRSAVSGAYVKGRDVARKGVAKTKQTVGKAKAKASNAGSKPKAKPKSAPKSGSCRSKAAAKSKTKGARR